MNFVKAAKAAAAAAAANAALIAAKAKAEAAAAKAEAAAAKAAEENAAKTEEYVVNTQQEDKAGDSQTTSLREAITAANKSYAEKVFINFQKTGGDKTKSWHIKPETPLPALLHKNIYINHSYPKNITIDGSDLPSSTNGARTYSLLTVGKYENISSESSNKPSVHLRHVNLVNNTIEGGKGSGGGGGGLAAGAGISVLEGDVILENVVFQNLQAKGGQGGKGLTGGIGFRQYGQSNGVGGAMFVIGYPAAGSSGGAGGLPTLLGANSASKGGKGGAAAKENYSNPGGGHGSSGKDGIFGVGGAGGGSGGGGYRVQGEKEGFWDNVNIFQSRPITYGDGGHGGSGGNGGFGAGGGGGGAGGENAWSKGNPQPGGSGGLGGSPHASNNGSVGGKSKNDLRYAPGGLEKEMTSARAGTGGTGAALGAALAILNPHSKVTLENVNFVNNKASSSAGEYNNIYSILENNRHASVQGKDLLIFNDYQGNGKRKIGVGSTIDNSDVYAAISPKPNSETGQYRHEATSFNRNNKLALIRDSRLIQHRTGKPDVTTIRIEQPGSTLRQVSIDSSALEQSINDIYKRLLPVEDEDAITNRFKSRIIEGLISTATSGFTSFSNAGNFFKASQNQFTQALRDDSINKGAAATGVQFLSSIWGSHAAYQQELAQNRRNLDDLKRLQNIDRQVTADPIDIGQDRTIVKISNFTVGEDKIYIEDYWPDEDTNEAIKITNGSAWDDDGDSLDSFEIQLKSSDNSPKTIAEVTLDPESVRILNSDSVKHTAVGYIDALTKKDTINKRWEIGTTLTNKNKIYQLSRDYTGGPAGELRIINRNKSSNLVYPWTSTTFNHNDIIVGSIGTEHINTNGGNDLIRPKYGLDRIDGGPSIDWASFTEINEPIQAIAKVSKNRLKQNISKINITNGASIISVGNSAFSDQHGNLNEDGADSDNTLTISDDTADSKTDTTAPTISINSDNKILDGRNNATITFTLSEKSTDFTLADVSVTGGSLSNFSGSGTSYTATLTPIPGTDSIISVGDYAFSDSEGNSNKDGTDTDNTLTLTETLPATDSSRPTISISSDIRQLNGGDSATITFTLSENSTDFTVSDVMVSGGSLSNFSGSGTIYTATFTSKIRERGLNSTLENIEVISCYGPSIINFKHAGAPNQHEVTKAFGLTDKERLERIEALQMEWGTSAFGLYISEEEQAQTLSKPNFSTILENVSNEVIKIKAEPLAVKHLETAKLPYLNIDGQPDSSPLIKDAYLDHNGQQIDRISGQEPANENEVSQKISAEEIANSLYKKRSEIIAITINEETSDAPINFLDNKMSAAEAYQLVQHNQLRSLNVGSRRNFISDHVEIWDKREDLKEPKLLATYDAVNNEGAKQYEPIHKLAVPSAIQDEISKLTPSNVEGIPGFYAIRSGSGSNIEGSKFEDHIIISMMDDENKNGFDATEGLSGHSENAHIYKSPSIIKGNGGNDKLIFAFEEAQDLKIIDTNFEDDRKGFKAVVNQDTIIALFKEIKEDNISTINNATQQNSSTILINNGELNYNFKSSSARPSSHTPTPSSSSLSFPCRRRGGYCADILDDEVTNLSAPNSSQPGTKIAYSGLSQTLPPQSETDNPGAVNDLLLSHYQFLGNHQKNKLTGTSKNDVLDGRGGNDHLIGRAGDDIFYGGKGTNLIKPGKGNDEIVVHPRGIQIIKNFDRHMDILTFPDHWKSKFLEFSDKEVLYKNTTIIEFI